MKQQIVWKMYKLAFTIIGTLSKTPHEELQTIFLDKCQCY